MTIFKILLDRTPQTVWPTVRAIGTYQKIFSVRDKSWLGRVVALFTGKKNHCLSASFSTGGTLRHLYDFGPGEVIVPSQGFFLQHYSVLLGIVRFLLRIFFIPDKVSRSILHFIRTYRCNSDEERANCCDLLGGYDSPVLPCDFPSSKELLTAHELQQVRRLLESWKTKGEGGNYDLL